LDVIVIGAGQAGVPLATRLATAGKRVLVVERQLVGGTCINFGCTPTKTMIASARAAHVARTAGRLGVHAGPVTVDFGAVVARKNRIVETWRAGVLSRLRSAGPNVELTYGHARFVAERKLDVAGKTYSAKTIVINVGARPQVPELPGLDSVPWLDNHRAM